MSKTKNAPSKKATTAGPVAMVWRIATKLGPKAERKDVLAACAKAGINAATAATQFQRWRHRNDKPKGGAR